MRKIFVCCLLAVSLMLVGCATSFSLSKLQFTGRIKITSPSYFSDEEKAYFYSLINSGKWGEGGVIKMIGDYTFTLENDVILSYASDMGAINDTTHNRYLVLTDEQKNTLNAILLGTNQSSLSNSGFADSTTSSNLEYGDLISITSRSFFSDEESAYFYSLLEDGKWKKGLIKMSGDYTFTFEKDVTLSYASDIGAINDTTQNRHLELTDEQKNALNEFLKP